MKPISDVARRRIHMQGFTGLSEAVEDGINIGLRISPMICLVLTAVGTALASPVILGSLVPFALLGAVLPGHPFDLVYHLGLRKYLRGERIPRYPLPRRFACLLASVTIGGAAWAFAAGIPAAGYVLGAVLVMLASVTVVTGFCIPSYIYGKLFGSSGCQTQSCFPARSRNG